jgi:hypothetical protein
MKASAVPVVLWAPGLYLVGDGPSYLLFPAEGRQVTHLTSASGLSRKVREALKGYQAIKDGKLVPLVQALLDFRVGADADFRSKEDAIRCFASRWIILMEISNLIHQSSEDKIFKTRLGKFNSAIKATRQLKMQLGS